MGLGKTVVMLTALEELINDRFAFRKCLIIAPLRVARDTWSRELAKWDHLRGKLSVSKILGTEAERIAGIEAQADIYIINRENVEWLAGYHGNDWCYDCVVIDELSSFKSHRSKRFKALRKVLPKIDRLYGLTGTPAPNGLIDLWAQIFLLDKGYRLCTGVTKFREQWFTPMKWDRDDPSIVYKWEPKPGASQEIYRRLKDITASVESGLVKLPPRLDVMHHIDMPDKGWSAYDRMLNTYIAMGDILAVNAAVAVNKLLQICNGGIYDEQGKMRLVHEAKLEKLDELYEASCGKNILIYYSFEFDKKRILEHFKRYEDVAVRELKTPESISAWMAGKVQVGVAHPASCGHGLNLQDGGSIIIWYGPTWSLELYQQANARLHRQGQQDTVVVHHILARDTVDQDVINRLKNKDIDQKELLKALLRRRK
jgi:SNF2 family DNA or RNA helicase